jgi:hypothetical protein
MRRHVIIGRLGTGDRGGLPTPSDEVATRLDLVVGQKRLGHGIGRALEDMAKLGVRPTEIGIDLLVLAAHVHAADTRISRATESQDGWTREIRLVVPVSDVARWTKATAVLIRMLNFLTGDRWIVGFRDRPTRFATIATQQSGQLLAPQFDRLSLFSGGLDSLINAINELHFGRVPLFVSHAGEGATSKAQEDLFEELRRKFSGRPFDRLRVWMAFPQNLVKGSKGEDSTRGRSFLFFALGASAGTGLAPGFTLQVPENGLIALNVPLDPLRLGSLSTRTTHPFYIARWNDLLGVLGVSGRLENPYADQTKGEMVAKCLDKALLRKVAPLSLSCSSPSKSRWHKGGPAIEHCGYCLPCLIRRAALIAGLGRGADKTTYTLPDLAAKPLSTRLSEGQQVRSFQVAIARVKARPELAKILIHKPGPLSDETPQRQADLASTYKRGLAEIDALIAGVKTEP